MQMRLAQDDEIIHALAPDGSDQPFGKAILPRRGWCNGLIPDAHGAQSACRDGAVDPIPISNEGVVRLTNHDLADHDRSGLSRCKLTPLGQSGRTVLFEDMAVVEVTVVVEVVVDRGVRGGKFLQGFDVPERHCQTKLA